MTSLAWLKYSGAEGAFRLSDSRFVCDYKCSVKWPCRRFSLATASTFHDPVLDSRFSTEFLQHFHQARIDVTSFTKTSFSSLQHQVHLLLQQQTYLSWLRDWNFPWVILELNSSLEQERGRLWMLGPIRPSRRYPHSMMNLRLSSSDDESALHLEQTVRFVIIFM
jgi:hypothetical protein